MTGMRLARIFFTISFLSGIPGLFITSAAFRIFSSECIFSSKAIPCSSRVERYASFNGPPSETNTSYPRFAASIAAPTPLSPPPNMTIRFDIKIRFQGGFEVFQKHELTAPQYSLLPMLGVPGQTRRVVFHNEYSRVLSNL